MVHSDWMTKDYLGDILLK